MSRETFDPRDIRRSDMNKFADAVEEYMDSLLEIMVIPDEIKDECEEQLDEGIKRTRKLIKKMRKGNIDVFKDEDEWNSLS